MLKRILGNPTLGSFLVATSLCGAVATAGEFGPPTPEPPRGMQNGVVVGAQFVSDRDIDDAKYEEYREVPEGAFLDSLRMSWRDDRSRALELRARDAGQDDESYWLGATLATGFRIEAWYDRTPHLYSRRTRSLLNAFANDRLTVADPVQRAFESLDDVANGAAGTANPLIPGLAESLVNELPYGELGYQRRAGGGAARFALASNWSARVEFQREEREGNRVLSAGSYERSPQGAGVAHTGDLFRPLITEFATPVDDATTRLTVATDFAISKLVGEVALRINRYDAGIESLAFDNPFRATDYASSSFRQRFALGIHDLAPDNESDELSISAGIDLPAKSRLHGTFSAAEWRQDDAFAPYSLNRAISTSAGLDVTDPGSLPESSLDGKVKITSGALLFSSRPAKAFRIDARLRYYDWNNDSREIVFPGYAAFSESAWRTNIEGTKVANHVQDWEKLDLGLEASLRLGRGFRLAASYDREDWDRTERSVEETIEDTFGLIADYQAGSKAFLRARWEHSDRDFDGEYDKGLEYKNLRAFDLAQRSRDELRFSARFTPSAEVAISANLAAILDEYEESEYGLANHDRWEGGIDLSWSRSEKLAISGFYSHQSAEQFMRSNAKDDGIGGTNFLPANDWNDDMDDQVDVVGLDFAGLLDSTWDWSARWSTTLGRTSFAAENPNGTTKLTNAIAYQWPDIESDLHIIDLRLGYRTRSPWRFGIGYQYEKQSLDDFTMDLVEPYIYDITTNTPNDNRRVFLLDQTYGDYDVHVGSFYVGYSF